LEKVNEVKGPILSPLIAAKEKNLNGISTLSCYESLLIKNLREEIRCLRYETTCTRT